MDQDTNLPADGSAAFSNQEPDEPAGASRRQFLKYGLYGLGGAALGAGTLRFGGAAMRCLLQQVPGGSTIFPGDAPSGKLWEQWQKQGWVQEARHWIKLGQNIQCRLCPNECILEPEDRSRCRNRVHKDGKLYTLAYGNACSAHIDPVEKKPLYHFLPGTGTFSFATSGCGFRCMNCQNWDISQRKPEELKDSRGDPLRLGPRQWQSLGRDDMDRMSLLPDDAVALAEFYACPSLSYTYSEPTVWFEYMMDTAKAARQKKLKNICVTCGYIQQEPLVELCQVIDAAHVDLKSFSEETYAQLNSGKLAPILATMKTLKERGVWFEVINLIVPSYSDSLDMIRRMCDWLVENLGPDCPLHFSRFHPAHKLTHLPPTPKDVLVDARSAAHKAGLHYVYVGNIQDVPDAGTTFCPGCKKPVIQRDVYSVTAMELLGGKCRSCGTAIAGVWQA